MALPKVPDMNPQVTVNKQDAVNLILFSIGMEEIGLSHIINAEGEKLQYVLGTLVDADGNTISPPEGVTVDKILEVNKSVSNSLKDILRSQLLLELKLEDALTLMDKTTNT